MSNTIAGVSLAEISQMSLPALQSVFAPLGSICTDFSDELSSGGASITTRYPVNPSTKDFSSGYSPDAVSMVARTITLDQFEGVSYGFTDLERTKSAIMLNDLFILPAATALGRKVFGSIWNLVTAANFAATPIDKAAASFGRGDIIDAGATLTAAGAPSEGRSVILNPYYYAAIEKSFISAEIPGFPIQKTEGLVPRVSKFEIYQSDQTDDNGEDLKGFAYQRSALLMAARRVDSTGFEQVGEVEDFIIPGLNLPVQLRRYYDAPNGQLVYTMGLLWGVQKGRTEFGVRIIES